MAIMTPPGGKRDLLEVASRVMHGTGAVWMVLLTLWFISVYPACNRSEVTVYCSCMVVHIGLLLSGWSRGGR